MTANGKSRSTKPSDESRMLDLRARSPDAGVFQDRRPQLWYETRLARILFGILVGTHLLLNLVVCLVIKETTIANSWLLEALSLVFGPVYLTLLFLWDASYVRKRLIPIIVAFVCLLGVLLLRGGFSYAIGATLSLYMFSMNFVFPFVVAYLVYGWGETSVVN